MAKSVTVEIEEVEGIPVTLGKDTYTAYPPKGVTAISLAKASRMMNQSSGNSKAAKEKQEQAAERLFDITLDWVTNSFSEEEAEAIMKRIASGRDGLDVSHMMDVMAQLLETDDEEDGERPTT